MYPMRLPSSSNYAPSMMDQGMPFLNFRASRMRSYTRWGSRSSDFWLLCLLPEDEEVLPLVFEMCISLFLSELRAHLYSIQLTAFKRCLRSILFQGAWLVVAVTLSCWCCYEGIYVIRAVYRNWFSVISFCTTDRSTLWNWDDAAASFLSFWSLTDFPRHALRYLTSII